MADEDLRGLERAASQGDPEAEGRLRFSRVRAGQCPFCGSDETAEGEPQGTTICLECCGPSFLAVRWRQREDGTLELGTEALKKGGRFARQEIARRFLEKEG